MNNDTKNDRHPLLQFFTYDHLPDHLASISRPFAELALKVNDLPRNSESTSALRRLLEAKDCAIRSVIFKK